jgi:DNA-binding NtrC family response regulator
MENKKVILVVDDELDFLKMIRMRLEANDYMVITAINGTEALEKVRDYKLDAVLLDVLMPGLNGLEVLKKIRQVNKDIPVFIITAFSSEDRFELAQKFAASGFIVKTSDLKKEVDNITSFLRMSGKYKS